jgi:hypothetical protein
VPNITGEHTFAESVDTNLISGHTKTVKPPHLLLLMTQFPDRRNWKRCPFYSIDRYSKKVEIFVFMARE